LALCSLPSGLFNLAQKKEKQVRWKMDDGMASAEISVICGSKPLTFLNSLMVRKFYAPFTIKGLRTLRKRTFA
jgi:hypothetical protein